MSDDIRPHDDILHRVIDTFNSHPACHLNLLMRDKLLVQLENSVISNSILDKTSNVEMGTSFLPYGNQFGAMRSTV